MERFAGFKHTDLTEAIIQAFYAVYNNLSYGFREKGYRNAMAIELRRMGLNVVTEAPITVYYEGEVVGEYFADWLVEDAGIVELKAVEKLAQEHEAQLLNHLKATQYEVGLLLNFGPQPEKKRKAFDNARKGSLRWVKRWNADSRRGSTALNRGKA